MDVFDKEAMDRSIDLNIAIADVKARLSKALESDDASEVEKLRATLQELRDELESDTGDTAIANAEARMAEGTAGERFAAAHESLGRKFARQRKRNATGPRPDPFANSRLKTDREYAAEGDEGNE